MAENLAYKSKSGVKAVRDNEKYTKKFGYFYNANIAQEVCPTGWHLPSSGEWNDLFKALDCKEEKATKICSTTGWKDKKNGTNTTGFNVYPINRYDTRSVATFHTSTVTDHPNELYNLQGIRVVSYELAYISPRSAHLSMGERIAENNFEVNSSSPGWISINSVRCVKD